MNALNFALRAAQLYTTLDLTKADAVDLTLFCDALTSGLADYWAQAPGWVTEPTEVTPLATVANEQAVTLPTHFEQLARPPRIRRSSSVDWTVLAEISEPLSPSTTGHPYYFRVRDNLQESPAWDDVNNGGNLPDSPVLLLYPTPDAVYSLDVQCLYHAPRITPEHLSGKVNTVNLPIPEHHLTSMVIPMCAPHFLLFPKRKADLTRDAAADKSSLGEKALAAVPARRTRTRPRVGTPCGF